MNMVRQGRNSKTNLIELISLLEAMKNRFDSAEKPETETVLIGRS